MHKKRLLKAFTFAFVISAMACSSIVVSAEEFNTEQAMNVNEQKKSKESLYKDIGVAKCEEYIYVRDKAEKKGKILGKVYNDTAVKIIKKDGDWYKVKTGSMEGFVHSDYFVTGLEAEKIGLKYGATIASVTASELNVRESESTDADTVTAVKNGDELTLLEDNGDWLKVEVNDEENPDNDVVGYVVSEYTEQSVDMDKMSFSESNEEEEARLERETNEKASESEPEEETKKENLPLEESIDEAETTEPVAEPEISDGSEQKAPESEYTQETTVTEPETYTEASEQTTDNEYFANEQTEYVETETTEAATEPETTVETDTTYEENYDETYADSDGYYDADSGMYVNADGTTYTEEEYPSEPEYTYDEETDADSSADTSSDGEYVDQDNSASSDTSETRTSLVNYALQFVGNPYVWGGTSLTNGADCSGFTQSVFADFGIGLARVAADQACGGTEVSLDAIQPGDLVFYSDGDGISHVAIYIGGGQIVHASTPENGIMVSNMYYSTPACVRSYL